MKALICDGYGAAEDVLDLRDVPTPVPGDHDVLVRVHASSLNDFDFFILDLPWPFRLIGSLRRALKTNAPPAVRIAGCDVAGTVTAVGSGVTRFRPGDDVYGDVSRRGGFGGFAQYVRAPEHVLALKPARMTFEQAAALPQAGVLAAQSLFAGGPLRPGQKILINGAGGGVGTIGVQLAKHKQPDVEVTGVDRPSKLEMMRSIGFDHVIDYEQEDFTKSGKRYDLIVDAKTKHSAFAYARALNPGGTYVTVGGDTAQLLSMVIFGWWIRLTTRKNVILISLKQNKHLADLSECFEAGKLSPVIDGPYALGEWRAAFRHFLAANHLGKVIIRID